MKKIIMLFLIALITGCSSNSDDPFSDIPDDELAFVSFDLNLTPLEKPFSKKLYDRYVYLFYLDGKHPGSDQPNPHAFDYGSKRVCYIKDVNNDDIFCDYSGKFLQDKDDDGYYLLKGGVGIFNKDMPYGLKIGNYLLVVETMGTYFCKELDIIPDKNERYAEYTFDLIQTADITGINKGFKKRYIWF
ncbi:MAG: hypothetical protein WC140_05150 [Bacteroidales bacterium]